jgi:hypothetical protein
LGACHHRTELSVSPATLVGVYVFDRAGHTAGHDWHVHETLTFDDTVHYEIERLATTDEEDHEEIQTGHFAVSGRTVVLTSDRHERTEFRIAGDSLIMKLGKPVGIMAKWVGGAPAYVRRR